MENRSEATAAEGEEPSRWDMIEAQALEAANFYATLWEILQFEWDRMVSFKIVVFLRPVRSKHDQTKVFRKKSLS